MILLDTHVVSEPLKPAPDPRVLAWLDAQPIETLHLAAISLAELRFGIAVLPKGKRRDQLRESLEGRVISLFRGRILPFDEQAASAYAAMRAQARTSGWRIGTADASIGAIAGAHGLIVATRDTDPFRMAGLKVIDPWAPEVVLSR